MKISRLCSGLGLLLIVATTPLYSDVLVTTDGDRIETRGPWEVEGRRIVFTTARGTLSAIRTSEVDLDASQAATAAASETRPQPRPVEESRKPVLVLDQANVKRHRSAPTPLTDPDVEGAAVLPGRVEVSDWQESQDAGEELRISGTLENRSDQFATDITLKVTAYDQEGDPVETRPATLAKNSLAKGASTTFSVDFPDLFLTNGATFEITNRGFVTGKPEEKGDEDDEPGDES